MTEKLFDEINDLNSIIISIPISNTFILEILESVLCQLNALSTQFLFKENNFFVNCRHGIWYRLV